MLLSLRGILGVELHVRVGGGEEQRVSAEQRRLTELPSNTSS